MGSGFVTATGEALECDGTDVCNKLNDVFGHPGKHEYQIAQGKKQLFYDIWKGDGDYVKLHDAYMAVGVKDTLNWKEYLGTLGADNIRHIAVARFEGLDRTKPMHTKTHDPKKKGGDHKVHWKHESNLSITIDSPFTPK
jgi:hypothetical protein